MSRKDQKNDVKEPWEQPIYDTEVEETRSRSERRQKRGNSGFVTVVLIALFVIASIPVGAGIITMNRNNKAKNAATTQTSSSTAESKTKESTKPSSSESKETKSSKEESSSSTETSSLSSTSSEQAPTNGQNTTNGNQTNHQTPEPAAPVYETVNVGEGPLQVAQRAGITLQEILSLNGLDETAILQPGQQLRVK